MVDDMLVDESELNVGSTEFSINSPSGDFSIDIKSYEQAKINAKEQLNPPTVSFMRQKIRKFLGGIDCWDSRYYDEKLGTRSSYISTRSLLIMNLLKNSSTMAR